MNSETVNRHKNYEFGVAPFRYFSMWSPPSKSLQEANPLAYNNAMAMKPACCKFSCDHCGMSITHHCMVEDSEGNQFSVGSSCIGKVDNCENLTKLKADIKDREREKRRIIRDKKRDDHNLKVDQEHELQRQVNGGLTDWELQEQERKEALEMAKALYLDAASYFVDAMTGKGSFCDSIILGFSRGNLPTGPGKFITIEIVTKTFGRKNSKAFKENEPLVTAKFEELKTEFEIIKGKL
jgi:hypothetical protein